MNDREIAVCHVITMLELGGAQQNTLHTVRTLGSPFRASLVCGPGGVLDREVLDEGRIDVTFVPDLVRPISPIRDGAALLRLASIFRERRPQIVHTHSSKAGILGRAAARLAGVPIVVHTIHGFGFNDRQPALVRGALVALERMATTFTTHFIAVSHSTLKTGIDRRIVPRERASVIRSGIAIAEFEAAARQRSRGGDAAVRREMGLPAEAPLVGMVACLKAQKAPLDFIEVAARVAWQVPEARFVIVGDGELRPAVEARARALGLGDRLRLLGWRRDVPRIVAALDVLVLTSLWEGLPRVVPEGIAAGVPIVATSADGTTDVLSDGTTGLVCRPGDLDGLSERVVRLLRDPVLAARLSRQARAVLPEFDIDAMVRAQEALYHDLLRAVGRGIEPTTGWRRAAGI